MNLRIDGQEFRFRVSKQELISLCEGIALNQGTYLPNGKTIEVSIVTSADSKTLSLHHNNNNITLHVGKDAATNLLNSLPSRDGIEASQKINEGHSLQLAFEVDIRTQKRKRG